MKKIFIFGVYALSSLVLVSTSGAQEEAVSSDVRYICNREDARGQIEKLGKLKLRLKADVLFKSRDLDFYKRVPIDRSASLKISRNVLKQMEDNPTEEFRIKGGRIVNFNLRPVGEPDLFHFEAEDSTGTIVGVGYGSGKPITALLETRDAKSLKKAIEEVTGMELLTKIEDRCNPPIDVKKARDGKRSKDKLQQQQHEHKQMDDGKNSGESAS